MSEQVNNNNDEKLLNKFKIPDNKNLDDYALQPIQRNSLFIKNGVMYVIGGVSSGKSTMLSKLMAVYDKALQHPIILSFYAGLSPDETTTFALNTFNIHPYLIKLATPEAMVNFYNQFRYKRVKLAELLMFLLSVYKDNVPLLLASVETVNELDIRTSKLIKTADYDKRVKILLAYVDELIAGNRININPKHKFIYLSDFLLKQFSKKKSISFNRDPAMFISICLISFTNGFHETTITVDALNEPGIKINPAKIKSQQLFNRFTPYTFKPMLRVSNTSANTGTGKGSGIKIELVPSISIFDDVAQYPLLTTERSNQWTKDLFAETRRYMNTFIIAGQRYNLLNKTLRSLSHTFLIGYSLVDDDLPKIAKEFPSNLLTSKEFILMYQNLIKPFHFLVYNNKLGYNIIALQK